MHTAACATSAKWCDFTRLWIHYGFLGHTVVCVLVAAIEGLLGR